MSHEASGHSFLPTLNASAPTAQGGYVIKNIKQQLLFTKIYVLERKTIHFNPRAGLVACSAYRTSTQPPLPPEDPTVIPVLSLAAPLHQNHVHHHAKATNSSQSCRTKGTDRTNTPGMLGAGQPLA